MKRTIEVSPDVFGLVWSCWQDGDSSEDDILRRVLRSILPKASAQSDRLHQIHKEIISSSPSEGDKRVLSSNPPQRNEPIPHRQAENSYVGKVRWVDDVVRALIDLGGEADLSAIYRQVEAVRASEGRLVVASVEATIRQTLESHSSDSENFERNNPNGSRPDLFRKVSRGRWSLRK